MRDEMAFAAIFQESPAKKARWLRWARLAYPVGSRVRVISSDEKRYIGLTGRVAAHDLGGNGEWPLVMVDFDVPPVEFSDAYRDGFYDDEEIQHVSRLRRVAVRLLSAMRRHVHA